MITCSLYGRLGNVLFQVAATIAHSKKHNLDFVIPTHTQNNGTTIQYNFPLINRQNIKLPKWIQLGHGYSPISGSDNICLHGHFQSIKYFQDQIIHVRDTLEIPKATINKCAIHVRIGDFKYQPQRFPVLPMEYYNDAIYRMMEYTSDFVVFSDDVEYCKHAFPNYTVVPIGDPLEDLKYMSSFKYQIIANSSYSLFAALINDKTVISPHTDNWFGRELKMHNLKDLLLDHFIKIKI